MKIVVCGPPHSGKSVFVDSLLELLPTDIRYCFRGTYDGEGRWSNLSDNIEVDKLRKLSKASYDETDIVRWCENIRKIDTPILLVDIGGKCLPDKIPFFDVCDAYIIVCREDQPEEIGKWIEMANIYHNECLLIAHTSLDDKQDQDLGFVDGYWNVILHQLHRGNKLKSETMRSVIQMLLDRKGESIPNKVDNYVYFSDIAEALGCENGQYTYDMCPQIYSIIKERATSNVSCMYGSTSAWVASITACCFRDNACLDNAYFFDRKTSSRVLISRLTVSGDYKIDTNPAKSTVSDNNDYVLLTISVGQEMPVNDLTKCILPFIDTSKPLFINGRLPLWFFASVVVSYESKEKYLYIPKDSCYICVDSVNKNNLGMTVKSSTIK